MRAVHRNAGAALSTRCRSRADAHADQREHVGAGVDDRMPHPMKERPAAPEHDRRRQHEAEPVHRGRADAVAERSAAHHVAHRQEKDRRAQHDADPEPTGHVDELGVRRVGQIGDARFERHAAFRTGARAVAETTSGSMGQTQSCRTVPGWWAGISCTGVGAGGSGLAAPSSVRRSSATCGACIGSRVPDEVFLRVGLELGDAALRAEVVRGAVVVDGARGAVGIRRSSRRRDRQP